MDFKDLAGKIASVAPGIGAAFGGPVGAAVGLGVKALASVFGLSSDATADQIDAAIQQDPQAALKLRMAEMDYNLALNKQKLDEQQMFLADVQSARNMDISKTTATGKRDVNLYALAWLLVVGFFGLVIVLIFKELPKDSNGVIFMLFGALSAGFGAVIQYFFGSSKGSMEKTELMSKMEPQKPC